MQVTILVAVLLLLTALGYQMGRRRSLASGGGTVRTLHSLPGYYGLYVVAWCAVPALLVLGLWLAFQDTIVTHLVMADLPQGLHDTPPDRMSLLINDIHNLATGNISSARSPEIQAAADHYNNLRGIGFAAMALVVLSICVGGIAVSYRRIRPELRARNDVEQVVRGFLIVSSLIAILTTIGIVLSLLFESFRFFAQISIWDFLFGLHWSPQMAIRADQVGASGSFGMIPVMAGTMLISAIAMLVAVPVGLLSAIYMAEYAHPRFRAVAKPLLEVLAGIPTVVYGFFAALVVAPAVREAGITLGLDVASESALAAGLVMGIMIIPFVSSLSDDVITAVPRAMREGSYGLGATRSETIVRVVLPAALPGIVGSVLLAVSRAIGETMIVVMAAGLAANLTANPFEAVTTVTVQIVTLLVGDQEFDSPKTLAAFALGLVLFVITLCLNVIALRVVQKYREKYD